MMMKETLETVAELLALAEVGKKRPFTESEKPRIGELCELSETPTSSDNDATKGLGVIVFWTTLVSEPCSEATRVRDKNIGFIKDVVVPHILRVTKPSFTALIERNTRGQ